MPPSTQRVLRIAGALVALTLVLLAFYPGTLADPYVNASYPHSYTHTIVPEGSSLYQDVEENTSPPVYQYDSLSPVAREMVDRTLASPAGSGGGPEFVPQVCRDFMVVCDTYREREMPAEFTYGMQLPPEQSFQFVEKDDERYLLQTGTGGHYLFGPAPYGFLTTWLTMPTLAVLVGLALGTRRREPVRAGAFGFGALVAALGLAAPYLEFYGLASIWDVRVLLVSSVWLAILGAGGYGLYRVVNDRLGTGRPDQQ